MADVTRKARSGGLRLGPRSKVRAQWLVLASALTVLAGVVVAWALSRAAARIEVVAAARPVELGVEIVPDDLTVVAVAAADGVTGLVPADSLDELVGRVASVPINAGSLIVTGMWTDGAEVGPGENTVGALVRPGRLPERLAVDSTALAVSIDETDAATAAPTPASPLEQPRQSPARPVPTRIVAVTRLDTGETNLVLAVPAADAPAVARLAATDRLVLIGVPVGASFDETTTDFSEQSNTDEEGR